MNTAVTVCPICGYAIAPPGIPWGYAGPVCQGHGGPDITVQGHATGRGQFTLPQFTLIPLTEADIRRIVREEMAAASKSSESNA